MRVAVSHVMPHLMPRTVCNASHAFHATSHNPVSLAVPGSPKEPPILDGPPGEGEEGLQKLLFVANYAGAVDAAIEVSCLPFMVALGVMGEEGSHSRVDVQLTACAKP